MRTRFSPGLLTMMLVCALAFSASSAWGQGTPVEANSQVVLKSRETPLKVGKDTVGTPDLFRVFRVARIQGDWAWVTAEGVRGWVRTSEVVPLDQAVDYFTRAIQSRPGDPWPYQMRGLIFAHRGDFEHAIADDSEAIKLDSRDPISYHNRGNARLARHDYAGAIDDFNHATDLDPKDAASYAHRALAWAAQRDFDLAIADANQAIRLDPHDAAKYRQRALAWAAKQDYEQALADYDEALKLDPNDTLALNGSAWIWATAADSKVRDGRKAVDAAKRAHELTGGKDPFVLGTLAAASAESGDFAAAVSWQSKALDGFSAEQIDLKVHRAHLKLYQAGKPVRDEPQNP